ncbi:hypothetical protein LTR84_008169 [Exophiala bonariae]|uniref:Uncharacterized protein n=1 Tax=Exophiala bonariae TaxID=1690606 RepID=A0AAV9MZH9_9EURO|nr:hypothetical protein LTR84_008169 [Exophiala bonariae]
MSASKNYQGDALVDANSDIAGTGVFWSYIATAWLTVVLATGNLILSHLESRHKATVSAATIGATASTKDLTTYARAKELCNKFVLSLCDIQAFAGTAMLVIGITLRDSVSLYHQEFIIQYWWLTIDSLWAADFQYDNGDEDGKIGSLWFDRVHQFTRKSIVLLSVTLGIYHQSWLIWNEDDRWNPSDGKHCYRFIERWYWPLETWIWIVGLAFYALAHALIMFKQGNEQLEAFEKAIARKRTSLQTSLRIRQRDLRDQIGRCPRQPGQVFLTGIMLGVLRLFIFVFWLFVQIVTIWAWSDGDRLVHIVVYALFTMRNTQGLLSHRNLNAFIVKGQEKTLGFGQLLPIIGAVGIVYQLMLLVERPQPKVTSQSP